MTFMASETLRRSVLLGVELIDPITLQAVSRGIGIKAVGLDGAPVTSWSGRFAWLAEDTRWPSRLEFIPGALPYEAMSFPVTAQPAGGAPLFRFMLRPTVAYPFGDGMTAARGRLREHAGGDAAPVAGALIWLAWTDQNGVTRPEQADRLLTQTDAGGAFAACLRLPAGSKPVSNGTLLAVTIMVQRGETIRQLPQDLPDGQLRDLPNALAWSELT